MLLPIVIIGLVGLGTFKALRRPAIVGMTAQRVKVYQAALETLKDPEKLRTLATAYEDAGCLAEARILKQRAALRELPKHVRAQRRDVFARAIRSSNPEAVRKVADAFAAEGALGASENLRRHAESIVEEAELLKIYSEPVSATPVVGNDEEEETEEVDDDADEAEEETPEDPDDDGETDEREREE